MGNRNQPPEHRVVISLVSERDYDTVQAIIAWPIRWLGILVAAALFAFVIPAFAMVAYALLF